ncbi:DUF4926 domain-containing protein [Spirosoma sp. BT702]|uniref:DUF4926 domain-containing protein n=1 Tax=Spirosoma profusum TaxID=2771354 RepID=A0A927ATY6_9BACT|nr:DUF4926 domain-containing protein [Spirosoma profusum]MBD2701502.1 DUF4926 domain-containing protein [Spirosoma profusum]
MDELHRHELVALTEALPAYNLRRVEIGVVVDIGPDSTYLLEFVSNNGVLYAMPTVPATQLMRVYLQADMVD